MIKKVFILLLTANSWIGILAQNAFTKATANRDNPPPEIISNVNPYQDQRLTDMVRWQIENNRKKNGVDGWSVNIFSSSAANALQGAMEVKKEFLSRFPDIPVYIQFSSPDFKVRVGDYRTRNEALQLRKQNMDKYPKSFEVWGKIKYPALMQVKNEMNRNE